MALHLKVAMADGSTRQAISLSVSTEGGVVAFGGEYSAPELLDPEQVTSITIES